MRGFEKRSDRIKTVQGQASQPFDLARNLAGRSRDQRFDPTQTSADRIKLQTERNKVDSPQLVQRTRMNDGSGGGGEYTDLEQARAQYREAIRQKELQAREKEIESLKADIDSNINFLKKRAEERAKKENKVLEASVNDISAAERDKKTYTDATSVSPSDYKKFKSPYRES